MGPPEAAVYLKTLSLRKWRAQNPFEYLPGIMEACVHVYTSSY
jgi:hypothetical protein